MPTHVELPQLDWTETMLEPEVRITKGGKAPPTDPPLPGRLLLGRPVSVRLTTKSAQDPTLRTFLEGHAGRSEFTLVHLGCSFRHADDEPFARASLQVRLTRADGGDGSEPIAWSMWPLRESEVLDDSTTAEIGADAKVFSAKVQRTITVKRGDVWLEGFGELQSDPGWEFTRTPRIPISGSYRLILVVMSDAGAPFGGQIDVTATVEHRLLGLMSYRARPVGSEQAVFCSG
jgi:hypothetical protein